MKILIFATTLGADLWSFAKYLDDKPDVELKIILKNKDLFLQEGIAELYPFKAELIDRKWYHRLVGVRGFKPDVTIMDNDIPARATSENGLILWHGFGWKGPNDVEEFSWVHRLIKWCWGSAKIPNKNFIWQCFGEWDFKHRTEVSGFHPENCKILGAASHDYLTRPVDLNRLQPYYPFDIVDKPTVLFAPTWHYGEVFQHWGDDKTIFKQILTHVTQQGANLILRLHDSFRFDDEYVAFLKELANKHPQVMLKFKDKNPDNILDLQASDVLITNYSSIANLFYATGKPTIHVYPVESKDESFMWRTHHVTGTREKEIDSVEYIWKLSPDENGGLMANSTRELLDQIELTLNNPDICRINARKFLNNYMLGADGNNCRRIYSALNELVHNITQEEHSTELEFINA